MYLIYILFAVNRMSGEKNSVLNGKTVKMYIWCV